MWHVTNSLLGPYKEKLSGPHKEKLSGPCKKKTYQVSCKEKLGLYEEIL